MGDIILTKNGEARPFPEELVPDAVAKGWALSSATSRAVSGEGRTVRAHNAAELAAQIKGGGRLETPQERKGAARQAYLEREYGDSPLTALGLGAASGLSLGLTDLLVEAAGSDEARELLRETARRNPKMFLAGQVGSAIVPGTGLARGSGLLARAVRFTPAGAASRLGQRAGTAAERAIQGAVGVERVTSPLSRAAALGVEGAVEGGLYTMGATLSDAVINDKPLSSEAMLAGFGSGGLFGGGIGGALGAASGVMARAARRGRVDVNDGILGAGSMDLASKEAQAYRVQLRQIGQAHDAVYDKAMARIEGDLANLEAGSGRRFAVLRTKTIPENWKAFDSTQQFVEYGLTKAEAKALVGRRKALGKPSSIVEVDVDPSYAARTQELQQARDALLAARKRLDKGLFSDRTKARWNDDALNRAVSAADDKVWRDARLTVHEYTDTVNQVARALDDAPAVSVDVGVPRGTRGGKVSEGAKLGKQLKDLKKSLGPQAKWTPEQAAEVAALQSQVKAASRMAEPLPTVGPYFKEAPKERLSDFLGEASRPTLLGEAAEGKAALDGMDAVALADAAGLVDVSDVPVVGPAADLLLKGRLLFRAIPRAASLPAARAIARKGKLGRAVGFAENAVQRAVSINVARGSKLKGAFGRGGVAGTLGDVAAGMQGAATGAAAKELFRDVAGQAGSVAKQTRNVKREVQKSLDAFVGARRAARKVIPASARIFESVSLGPVEADKRKTKGLTAYQLRERELQRAISNLPVTEAKVHQSLEGVRNFDVDLADLMYTVAMRRLHFLASKLPRNPGIGSRVKNWQDYKPAAYEQMRFARYVAATEDPLNVLRSLETGTITPEEVEALEAVYPEIYQYTQAVLIQYLPKLERDLPYDKKVQLSILFKVPVDSSMRPGFVKAIQAMYQERQAAKQADAGRNPPARPLSPKLSGAHQTPSQRLGS